jgi:4-aminobutyrate aminotransferase-like enzyme
LRSGIERLAGAHELIGDIRGSGLFLGVELVGDRATKIAALDETTKLVNFMRRRRVLISATGPRQNVLKIRPPLNFTNDNADLLLGVLEEGLVAVRG